MIPNTVCRYSTLKRVNHHSCGPCIVTFLQRLKRVGEKTTLQWKIQTNTTSSRWSRLRSTLISQVDGVYLMWCREWHLPSGPSSQESQPNHEENRKFQLRDTLPKGGPVLSNCQGHQTRKAVETAPDKRSPRETRQLNVMWYPEWEFERETGH